MAVFETRGTRILSIHGSSLRGARDVPILVRAAVKSRPDRHPSCVSRHARPHSPQLGPIYAYGLKFGYWTRCDRNL